MHLVFLNQYYPPDAAPTGVMLKAVVDQLTVAGHQVTVLCAAGGYADAGAPAESKKGGELSALQGAGEDSREERPEIVRISATRFGRGSAFGKLLDYASYYLGVGLMLMTLRPKPDQIVALTTPPYLSVLARLFSKLRGCSHGDWVMDLYPDVMAAHGMLSDGSFPYRGLAALGRWGFGGSRRTALLTLGPDMAERVGQAAGVSGTQGPSQEVKWVPLWGTDEIPSAGDAAAALATEIRRRNGWAEEDLVVMYSGNMGLGHRFPEFLAAAKELSGSSVRFVFCGGGKRKPEVETFARENPECGIQVRGYAPAEELASHLMSADIHLASLEIAWTGTMVPSKLQGIFAVGRPVIFVGDPLCSLGRWIAESGAGWVVLPGDNQGMMNAIHEARDVTVREGRGKAAKTFANEHFNREINARKIAGIFTELKLP